MKYKIKNCPNLLFKNGIPACALTWKITLPNEHFDSYTYCQDCSGCLLKQIVDKCKENKFVGYGAIEVENPLYSEIMQKLEIEEVNE